MKSLRFGIPFIFLATAPLGFLLGGAWSWLTLAVVPIAVCGLDRTIGFDRESHADQSGLSYRALPWLYIGLQIAVIVWGAAAIAGPKVTLVEALGLTASVGVTAGIFGILAGHGMIHSPHPAERGLGLALLASVGYMHFRIAHIQGHHVRGATVDDPASARRGESVYAFIVRSVVGQVSEAWGFEADRLRRRGRAVFGPSNRMLAYFAVEAAIVAGMAALSPRSLAFWLAQAVLAVIMLELFNYIAHYGLQRRRRPSGGFEPIDPRHSWNSLRRMNNWSLFNMGRHSDHHRSPTREYQHLEAETDAAPELPAGYAGAVAYALIPPLWRRIMDSKVDVWMARVAESDVRAARG
jgi:alkane 1-monooxygenase